MNPRACDFDDPQFPPLKKKVDKQKKAAAAADFLFADGDLFSATNIDGQNVIEQNSDASLCERSFDICCHKKATRHQTTPAPTPPRTISSSIRVWQTNYRNIHINC